MRKLAIGLGFAISLATVYAYATPRAPQSARVQLVRIHGADGSVLWDLDTAPIRQLGERVSSVDNRTAGFWTARSERSLLAGTGMRAATTASRPWAVRLLVVRKIRGPRTSCHRRGFGLMLIRGLLPILLNICIASFAGAKDYEKLAEAVEAVVQASRSNDGITGSQLLGKLDREQVDLLRRTFGPDVAKAVGHFEVHSVLNPPTSIAPHDDVLADILRAEPGLVQFGSIGLARVLRQTQQYYAERGGLLPDAVKAMLSITFPEEVLDRVRVIDTDAEETLPAIINEVQTNFGEAVGGHSAVTIDNIIAFSEIPEPSAVDFWAHEIQHVMQYRKLGGIDAFAAAYTKDYRRLEDDANAVAQKAVIDAQKVLLVIRVLNSTS
jgi:hypothetical protein